MPAQTPQPRGRRRARTVRQYSRDFTPRGAGRSYTLQRIPAPLWDTVRTKARRDGVSLRALILTQLRDWAGLPSPTSPPAV